MATNDRHTEADRPDFRRLQLVVSALILLILALGFNVLLNLVSLDKLYVDSIVSQYRLVGHDLERYIEKSLRLGKDIRKFVGIDSKLRETRRNVIMKIMKQDVSGSDSRVSISIAMPGGAIGYSTNDSLVGGFLPAPVSKSIANAPRAPDHVKHGDGYYVMLPVTDFTGAQVAHIVIAFGERQISEYIDAALVKSVKTVILVLGCAVLLLIFSLSLPTSSQADFNRFKKRTFLLIFLVIGSSQIVFSVLNANTFREHYMRISREKAFMITSLMKKDIEFFLSKGIDIGGLLKMNAMMAEIVSASRELDDIAIFDSGNRLLYYAAKEKNLGQATLPAPDSESGIRLALESDGQLRGYVATRISEEALSEKIWDIAADSLTIILISILFFVEMLVLLIKYLEQRVSSEARETSGYGVMRPAGFLFLFGIDMSMSFLPLHMEEIYTPILGLSKDMIMGLPISAEFFLVGISILLSGIWLDRRGWREPFYVGLVLAGVGSLYSWLSPDAIHFIVSRGVVGAGYGLTLMACQGFVIAKTDRRSKAQGLAHLFAGVYAGSISGGVAGAMLAERLGFSPVFLGGAVIVFSVIVYGFFFIRGSSTKPTGSPPENQKPRVSKGAVRRFLGDRTILSLIFLSSLPASVAVVGFLNYFIPVYLNRIGESQSTIGRVLMIYGVCLVYGGPIVSRYVDGSDNKKRYIVLGCFLGSLSFLVFHFIEGLSAVCVAILLLGFSSCFVIASQSAFVLQQKVTHDLGDGKAIGIFRSTGRMGQMLGPIVFSWLIITADINAGVTFFGMAYFLTAILFYLLARKETPNEEDV